jgi:hypothetical protein
VEDPCCLSPVNRGQTTDPRVNGTWESQPDGAVTFHSATMHGYANRPIWTETLDRKTVLGSKAYLAGLHALKILGVPSDDSGDVVVVNAGEFGAEACESDRRLSSLGGRVGVFQDTVVR